MKTSRPRIGIISDVRPGDRDGRSGMPYFSVEALRKHFGEPVYFPFNAFERALVAFILLFGKALNIASRILLRKRFKYFHTTLRSRTYAWNFDRKLKRNPVDYLFAPVAEPLAANLKTDLPLIHFSDSTFAAIEDYYPEFSGVLAGSSKQAHRLNQQVLDRCHCATFYTQWAVDSAVRHYHADPDKLVVAPPGPHLEDGSLPTREEVLPRTPHEPVRLLMVGRSWVRKGGRVAFETLRALKGQGLPATLTVAGCTAPKGFEDDDLRVIPYLNKNRPEDLQCLLDLYREHDLMIFCTEAECFGAVMVEAFAFGMPVLGRDTGGVSGAIRDGHNGLLLPSDSKGEAFASAVRRVVEDPDFYGTLAQNARADFETTMNWDAWGRTLRDRILAD